MGSLIEVRVRDCACPATPHPDGDIVYIRPKIGLEGGIAAQVDFATTQREIPLTDADRDSEDEPTPRRRLFSQTLQRRWMVTFVRFGAVDWNLLDERGQRVPFDVEELLADYDLAYTVADRADDLYAEAVMRPLLPPPSKTSTSGPNVVSMSRAKPSTRSRQRSSSPPDSDGTPSQARAG
jgi:hypothetical protein